MDHSRLRISAGLCHSGWGNERQQDCADREFRSKMLEHGVSLIERICALH